MIELFAENADFYLSGFRNTLLLFAAALTLSVALGTVMAAFRVWGPALVSGLATIYVEFFRSTPLLIQLIFYGTFLAQAGLVRSPMQAGIIGLSIYTGAFVTEVVRSGILSVDARQLETARSLGLTQVQALRHVVMPQAVRTVIPPLGNVAIALAKNTTLVGAALAAEDLLKVGQIVESRTFDPNALTIVVLGYLAITLPLAWTVGRLERRMAFAR